MVDLSMPVNEAVEGDTRGALVNSRSIITPTLLGMILCAMLGWAPLLIVPPLIASFIAWRDRNLPVFYLVASMTVAALLLSIFLVAVLRTPFI